MSNWHDYYKNRVNNIKYEEYFYNKYNPFINCILKNINGEDKILEMGCGTALITKLISRGRSDVNFNISDNDPSMLKLSELNLNNKNIDKALMDIKKPLNNKFSIIHSHGVLEHFNPSEIKEIINIQLKASKYLIHYVPSGNYKNKGFGDELLISKESWQDIAGPDDIIEFNKGYDLILIWHNKELIKC